MTTTDFTDIKILLRSERAEVAGVTISEANGVYTITVDDFVANEWSEEYPTLSAALARLALLAACAESDWMKCFKWSADGHITGWNEFISMALSDGF